MIDREYISVTDTAKLIREALKHSFPTQAFSVRSKSYSGGASVTVYWTDGPRTKRVDAIIGAFAGCTFDGMIDLKEYHDTVVVGPNGPRRVHYGANFVFSSREVSDFDELCNRADQFIRSRCVLTPPKDGWPERFGSQPIDQLSRMVVHDIDHTEQYPLEKAFQRMVLRKENQP